MFALSEQDLNKSFIDCGSGINSFNEEMRALGHEVISCDDLYAKPYSELEKQTKLIQENLRFLFKQAKHVNDTHLIGNVESFLKEKRKATEIFLNGIQRGKEAGYYLTYPIKSLPYKDFHFDIALSSHYFFGERDNSSLDFHLEAIGEMTRVASDVRIFPLVDKNDNISSILGPLSLHFQEAGYNLQVKQVDFSIQKQGNALLRIWKNACDLDKG